MHTNLVKLLAASAFAAAGAALLIPASAQDDLPPGPGMAETMKGCGGCHGIGQILSEHRSRDEWATTVTMMVTNGAPVADTDFDKVVDYLATYFGTTPPPASPAAAPSP